MSLAFRSLGDDEDDSADDIDEIDTRVLAQPLLSGSESEEEEQGGAQSAQFDPWKAFQSLAEKAGSLQKLYRPGRRRRGRCPVCGEAVRSGAHRCGEAQWKLREGQLADSVRCDGNAHFRAGRYEEAATAYGRALELSPEDARLWSNRAACLARLGRHEAALADAEAAVGAAPGWFKGYFRKARLLEAREDWEGAAEAYRLAGERCLRREERARAGRYLAAARARCAAVRQVSDLQPAFSEDLVKERWLERKRLYGPEVQVAECHLRLGEVEKVKAQGNRLVAQGCWQEAAEAYRRGLKLVDVCPTEPVQAQAEAEDTATQRRRNHLHNILDRLPTAIGKLPDSPRHLPETELQAAEAAKAARRRGRTREAALLANLALAELRLGLPAEAAAHCREVLALDPRSAKARFRLATALGELGEAEAALREVEVALALEPADTAVQALRRKLRQEWQLAKQRERDACSRMFRR